MKTKTINAIITKKILNWLDSIQDYEVREIAAQNVIVTGGCISSMLLKEKVNDFDVYFKTREAALAITRYYIDVFNETRDLSDVYIDEKQKDRIKIVVKSSGVAGEKKYAIDDGIDLNDDELDEEYTDLEEGDYKPVFISSNAITLSNKIQLITRFYGSPDEIHENFDFVHATNYWTSWDKKVILNKDALESLLTKELRYVGSKYPLCSIFRTRKFINRGWHINAGQYLKMVFQLNDLDLCDTKVLEEQLIGVDTLYMQNIIRLVNEEQEKGEKFDSSYLITLVDRLF